MKLRAREQDDLLRPKLTNMIDPRHALMSLAARPAYEQCGDIFLNAHHPGRDHNLVDLKLIAMGPGGGAGMQSSPTDICACTRKDASEDVTDFLAYLCGKVARRKLEEAGFLLASV